VTLNVAFYIAKGDILGSRIEKIIIKSETNSKVNLGGPGKRTPRKTASRNRGIERKRDEKKKKK
jgi:hypothetical protein